MNQRRETTWVDRYGLTLSRNAEAKVAKTKWPSGAYFMYPLGARVSIMVSITVFADSRHLVKKMWSLC